MNDKWALRRSRLLVRLREVEHGEAAAALARALGDTARAHSLALRTSTLCHAFAVRRDAGFGHALQGQMALSRQTHALHQQAERVADRCENEVDALRADEQAARKRRDRAAEARDAQAAHPAIGDNEPASVRSRHRLARELKRRPA